MATIENNQNKRWIGVVKWFDKLKGYGFIRPNGSTLDIFVHISALDKIDILIEGQKVSYEAVTDHRGKTSAVNVRLITDES